MFGIIDIENGIIYCMLFYEDVKDVLFGEVLVNYIGVLVYIQYDISVWIMVEFLFGVLCGVWDVIQVVIDYNVGVGVIIDGCLLYVGSSSLVEIGYIQVDFYGKCCYCGNYGCLEMIVSVESVLELVQMCMVQLMSLLLYQCLLSVEWFCQVVLQGDLLVWDIISGVGNYVGWILVIMVNLFNLQKILIGLLFNLVVEIFFLVIFSCIW